MKPEISEEIISGWRREFEETMPFKNPQPLIGSRIDWISKNNKGEYPYIHVQVAWIGFKAAKASSHDRILELEREIDRIRKRGINEAMGDMKTYYEEKLTKRDELLKRSLLWNEAMLKIAIVSIDEEKQRAETASQLYQLIADIKQLEQEK